MARRFYVSKKRGTPRVRRMLRSEMLERREVLSAAGLGVGAETALGSGVQAGAGDCDTVQVASQDCDPIQQQDQTGATSGGAAMQMRQQQHQPHQQQQQLKQQQSPLERQQQQQQDCPLVNSSLSVEDADSLMYMRQEEKLARDVYQAMDALYGDEGVTVFANIAASEQQHLDAIGNLIDKYDLDYPDGDSQAGVYADAQLQQLYDGLIARGSSSLAEAYQVGIDIEVIDIADLQTAIDATDNAAVAQVYSHLLAGSQNHLEAFTAASEGNLTCPTCTGTGGSGSGSGQVNGQGGQNGDQLQSQQQDQLQTNLQQCDEQDPDQQQLQERDRAFEEIGAQQGDQTRTQLRDPLDGLAEEMLQQQVRRGQ